MRLTLARFLEENNVSVEDAALKTGISESVIKRVMRGTIPASKKTKTRFKEVYDLDITEVNTEILTKKESEEEVKSMKQEVKSLKSESKSDIKDLTSKYKSEKEAILAQIALLERQSEINDLKMSLVQLLNKDDSFFSRLDVSKTIKRLVSLSTTDGQDDAEKVKVKVEVQEDDKIELNSVTEDLERPTTEVEERLEEDEEKVEETEIDDVDDINDDSVEEVFQYPEDIEIEDDDVDDCGNPTEDDLSQFEVDESDFESSEEFLDEDDFPDDIDLD